MKTRNIIMWILILIIIDQAIKILIHNFYGEINFDIISSLIEFKPTFNAKYSWVNSLLDKHLGINTGLVPHVILYLIIGVIIPTVFSYFRNKIASDKKMIDVATIFIMAAIVCALLGNIAWTKGTLDYIYLKPLFVFDLKDVYIDFGLVLFLIYVFKNRTQLEQSTKGANLVDVYNETMIRFKKMRK
ncbi:MAG: signal peptidase II [Bacteroidia bacterium]|nr:signal peptidase II [Bacteroidia bacterium]